MLSFSRIVGTGAAILLASRTAVATAAALLPGLNMVAQARNTSFSAIVAFGDSFTDNGNGSWVASNHTWPANPNYVGGRFSNGPVWVEYVAGNLSIPLVDFAVGGATTSNNLTQGYTGPNSTIPVPSVEEQVANFLQNGAPSNVSLDAPLFVLQGGANDPLFNLTITANQSFYALLSSTAQLVSKYPTAHFLFLDYPDLARIPMASYVNATTKQPLYTYSIGLDDLYRNVIPQDLEAVTYIDVLRLFAEWDYYAEPAAFGFGPFGAYGSCLTGAYGETPNVTLCDDADRMVFWDEYHPTTHAHSWIAKLVLAELGN